jgi:RNA polymerase sigma-70 factor (ECF subfamily)
VNLKADESTRLEAQILARLDEEAVADAATLAIHGYGPEIFGYLVSVLRSEERAADAFTTFSERVWRGLVGIRRGSSIRAWAYKLAVHAAFDEELQGATAANTRAETKTPIDRLRDELSAEEQTLLILRIDRALEWEEIAEVLDADAATLRTQLEQLKARLRALATERGIGRE